MRELVVGGLFRVEWSFGYSTDIQDWRLDYRGVRYMEVFCFIRLVY